MGKGAKQIKRYEQAKKVDAIQLEYDRWKSRLDLGMRIKNIQREIDFKKEQLKTGVKETRTIHTLPDGSAAIVDGFVEGVKPKHVLENEIDAFTVKQQIFEEQLRQMKIKEEEEKNARSAAKG